jgi:nucleotide sugar dehydrogenase
MNEILQTCDKLKIDFQEVLRLAKTKWNFCNFQPGLVGGHCLPVDPYYLSYIAKKYNYKTSIILAGRNMNNNMVKFVKKKIIERIKKNNLLNKKFKILILGLTYKANVADFRNSLALKIYFILKKTYKNVYAFDHFYLEKQKKIKVERNINNLKKYDLIIPLVNHDKIKKKIIMLTKKNNKILDIFGFYKNY